MKLLFASRNRDKIKEVEHILAGVKIITPQDLDDNAEVEETGATLAENAFIKADYYYQRHGVAVFADDTGLVVPALNGDNGVRSARFAGEEASYADNNRLLLSLLAGKDDEERTAYFQTVICFIDEAGHEHYFTGRLEGVIIRAPRGERGFGYDPIFFVPDAGKTLAEMAAAEKNLISHRRRALNNFRNFLEKGMTLDGCQRNRR